MHSRHSGSIFPNPHSFYIPEKIAALNGLSVSTESGIRQPSSILMIVTGGSGDIDIGGEGYRISSGSVLCCDSTPGIKLRAQYDLQGVWIEYSVMSLPAENTSPLNSSFPLGSCSSNACALASRLFKAWNEPEAQKPFSVQLLFTELLTELYSKILERADSPLHWLEQTLQYIENHFDEDLTRSRMAELAKVSPEHFSRAFRRSTGQTFSNYLTMLRIRRAQQRILTGAPNLTALALEVGYGEGTYLSRKFKQVVGISPTAYQRKSKRIVSLNFNHTASLRAIKVMPLLGVYSAWMESLERVSSAQKLRFEASSATSIYDSVAAARPDVIISYALPEESKQLMPVAPLIELPYMQMSWREQFQLIAGIADRQAQADAWLRHYDELCHNANLKLDRHIGPRGTAIVWEFGEESAYCFSSSYGHGSQIIYGDLGFEPPLSLTGKGLISKGYIETSIEGIADYPADHIFITSGPSSIQGEMRFNTLLHSSRWLELDAVRNTQVYHLNEPELFYGFDPLSSLAQLKLLMQHLIS